MTQVTNSTAKLSVLGDHSVRGEYRLTQRRMVIGDEETCEIPVAGENVAPRHAMISTVLEDSFVEDLGSASGTHVNGRRIAGKTGLNDGDVIGVGNVVLHYRRRDGFAGADAASEQTLSIPRFAPGSPRSGLKFGRLTVLTGPARGRGFNIKKSRVTVGRLPIQVAMISRVREGYFFQLREARGAVQRAARVNGEVTDTTPRLLHDGDVIEMAGVKLEFVEIF